LSRFGYCSRSQARGWLRAGRVTLGGEAVREADLRVSVASVLIDQQPVTAPDGLVVVLHKPAGHVCSRDEREGASIFDLIPEQWSGRNPPVTSVGRLDRDTTGLLLLTDIGALVQRWTSPRHHVPKLYEATLDQEPSPNLIDLFNSGTLQLDGESKPCAPARLELLGGPLVRLTLTEGRFHQVKRMFAAGGRVVTALHRSQVGDYRLNGLAPGEWRLEPVPALGE